MLKQGALKDFFYCGLLIMNVSELPRAEIQSNSDVYDEFRELSSAERGRS